MQLKKAMFFHRREDAQFSLHTACIVISNIVLDHLDEPFLAGETPAIVVFSFQDMAQIVVEDVTAPVVDIWEE